MKKQPNVLLICLKDYANVAYTYQEALRSVGVNANAFSAKDTHRLQYPKVASNYNGNTPIRNQKRIYDICSKADAIIWMHSQFVDLGLPNLQKKKKLVFHGGTAYRRRFVELNGRFNPIVNTCLIQTLDLWGLGAKNPVWMLPAVNTEFIKPTFKPMKRRKLIAHYPHVPKNKGSDIINEVLASMKSDPKLSNLFEFDYSQNRVPWMKNLERIRACDIYIESLSQASSHNRHDWSVTALEAASMGKIVVTNILNPARYKKEYGSCALHAANNAKQLRDVLTRLITIESDIEFQQLKSKSREWVEKIHSYKVIGERLRKVLKI